MTRGGQFWTNAEQVAFFRRVVHDNPQQVGEGALAYTERIALLTGALKERLILPPDAELKRGQQGRIPPAERVPGEDDVDEELEQAHNGPRRS